MSLRIAKNLLMALFVFALASVAAAEQPPQTTPEGLVLTPSKNVELLYTRPGATLKGYDKVGLLDCYVAFKKNWQQEQNETGIVVTSQNMANIQKQLAAEFSKVFTAELTAGGYSMTQTGGADVLILRPAIVDLDIEAPDMNSMAGMGMTFSTSAGSMTLVLELYDGATGQLIARAFDRENARDDGMMQWQTSVTNKVEADRILKKWADVAVQALNNAHSATGSTPPAK